MIASSRATTRLSYKKKNFSRFHTSALNRREEHSQILFCPECITNSEAKYILVATFCCIPCSYFHLESIHGKESPFSRIRSELRATFSRETLSDKVIDSYLSVQCPLCLSTEFNSMLQKEQHVKRCVLRQITMSESYGHPLVLGQFTTEVCKNDRVLKEGQKSLEQTKRMFEQIKNQFKGSSNVSDSHHSKNTTEPAEAPKPDLTFEQYLESKTVEDLGRPSASTNDVSSEKRKTSEKSREAVC